MDTCAETNDVAFSEFSSVFLWVRKTPFWCHLYYKPSIYQDRLGTNTRKTQNNERYSVQAVQQATTVATKGTVNGCMLGCDTSSMDSGEAQIEAAFEAMARGAIMYSYFEPPLMNLSTGYENRGWTREGGAATGYNETLFRWFYGKEATSERASFVAIFPDVCHEPVWTNDRLS